MKFEQLFDTDRLREAFRGATGKGVTVAVLDTGVDLTHEAIPDGAVVRSVDVRGTGQKVSVVDLEPSGRPGKELDPVGHGTACAGIILRNAPDVRLISVRVIGANALGTGEQFVRGLEWAISEAEPRPDVINLSLGTTHRRYFSPLLDLVEKAYFRGSILVAAGPNMRGESFPSKFAALVAVDNESIENPFEFQYRRSQPVEFAAAGIYVRAPDVGGGYRLWTGTSFACPHVTAAVARLRSIDPDYTPFQIKTMLHALSIKEQQDGETAQK